MVMKRVALAGILALVAVIAASACGQSATPSPATNGSTTPKESTTAQGKTPAYNQKILGRS